MIECQWFQRTWPAMQQELSYYSSTLPKGASKELLNIRMNVKTRLTDQETKRPTFRKEYCSHVEDCGIPMSTSEGHYEMLSPDDDIAKAWQLIGRPDLKFPTTAYHAEDVINAIGGYGRTELL